MRCCCFLCCVVCLIVCCFRFCCCLVFVCWMLVVVWVMVCVSCCRFFLRFVLRVWSGVGFWCCWCVGGFVVCVCGVVICGLMIGCCLCWFMFFSVLS